MAFLAKNWPKMARNLRPALDLVYTDTSGPDSGASSAIFGQKLQVLAKNGDFFRSKNFQRKNLFFVFLHFRPFPIVFDENKKIWSPFWPLFGPFWSPLAHSVHRAVPGLASKLRYLLDEKVKVFSILARPKMLPVHSSSTLHTSFSFCRIFF